MVGAASLAIASSSSIASIKSVNLSILAIWYNFQFPGTAATEVAANAGYYPLFLAGEVGVGDCDGESAVLAYPLVSLDAAGAD